MTFVNKRYNNTNFRTVLTPNVPDGTSVGTASQLVVPTNSGRAGLIIVNLSSGNIYLSFGTPAQVNKGLALLPDWGFEMDEYTFCVDDVYAIADFAGSQIAVQEFNV